jgi:predicted aminopeptidase
MAAQGLVVDWVEVAQAVADISEIAGTQKWVRTMSAEEKQALQAKNEFAQQVATKQIDNQNQLQQIQAKGQAQSQTAMIKAIIQGVVEELKEGADPMTGEASELQQEAQGDGSGVGTV